MFLFDKINIPMARPAAVSESGEGQPVKSGPVLGTSPLAFDLLGESESDGSYIRA